MARPEGPRGRHDAAATHAGRRRDRLAGGAAEAGRRAAGRGRASAGGVGGRARRRAPRRGGGRDGGGRRRAGPAAGRGGRAAGRAGRGGRRRRRAPGGPAPPRRGGAAAGRSLPLEVTRRAGGLRRGGGRLLGGGARLGRGRAAGAAAGASSAGRGRAPAAAGASAAGAGRRLRGGRAAAFLVVFLAALAGLAGSSGWTSRMRPSRSALRRTRSACASSMLEECVLTPIPSDSQRSSVSLFVIPSSLASSCTRFFGAKFLVQSFMGGNSTAVHPRTNPEVGTIRYGPGPGGQPRPSRPRARTASA